MTVIAYDGKTLAADKRAVNCGMVRTVTKLFRVKRSVIGIAGMLGHGMEMLQWFKDGGDPAKFPACQRDKDDWGTFVVLSKTGLWVYERTPYPHKIEDDIWAGGSGRDFALMAMHLGKTAREAVELASLFENGCGNGVDAMTL